MSDEMILHHYDASPFSEKVRVVFGMKGLAWRSVQIPNIMPKPDLMPLTGGYRRTPVMQIGADVFCDTQVILAEIDRRHPDPRFGAGLAWSINLWADRSFFQATVPIIFGALGRFVPEAFIKDREQLSGRPFDVEALGKAAAPMRGQWRAQAGWIEGELARGGKPWLGGDAPTLADAAAYMNVWFLQSGLAPAVAELTAGFTHLPAWKDRVAGLGHGTRVEMDSKAALGVAASTEPEGAIAHDPADPLGLAPGAAVIVMADDYGRDPIAGRLVAATPERIVIERAVDGLGTLHLHFPRAGYIAVAG
jgi:glutathione S-transferase